VRLNQLARITGAVALVLAPWASAPALCADGLRINSSDFGVAAPAMSISNMPTAGAEDGDLTTFGRSRLRFALIDQPGVSAGFGLSSWDHGRTASALFTERSYVPLLHAFGEYRFWRSFRVGGDIDALGGGQGRGLDAGMRLSYDFSPGWSISAAYRLHREGNEVSFDPVDQGHVSFGTRLRF
jgi:hypothetical protein